MTKVKTRFRCTIYTRKSTDEGLDQAFNALDAQRAACEAYIMSQAGEGWECLPELYDDGGWSGGNRDRTALKQLLEHIAKGRIEIVVVYKVDRLTRSLMDFARIVETFDSNDASFVSVTQAFNTTNSMGRLTLNVLLSFAQFEREVTGERIRDKIAASRARGIFMGGLAALGYDLGDRKLVVNEAEAETVRFIYTRYLELGSIVVLARELDRWVSAQNRRHPKTAKSAAAAGSVPALSRTCSITGSIWAKRCTRASLIQASTTPSSMPSSSPRSRPALPVTASAEPPARPARPNAR
ncbi:MAG: recombinase family protein [Novosphingobium sp.]